MSNLSVNNFPRLTNDFNQQNADLPKSVDKSAGEIRANTPGTVLKNNPAVVTDGTVTFNKDALEKLFELFEYAFKAIRNMLSGQGGMPKLVPDAGPLPKPEKSSDTPVKDKADSKSNVPDTAAKDKAGTDSQVPNTVAKDKAETNSPVLNTALKDKSGTNPEVSVQKDKPANNPAFPSSEVKVTPKPLPDPRRPDPASGKDVQPNSRSSSDVNVTVQVMNCHCPHPDATKPVPPKPDAPVPPKPDAPVPPKPDVPVPPKPDAPVPPKP
ncbi:adhesin, partial [Pseudomonas sp. SDO558_S425]